MDALDLIQIGGRSDFFTDYYAGVFASNLMMRCIKKAKWIDDNESEEKHKKLLITYFQTVLEMPRNSLGGSFDQFANLVIDAYKSSKKGIKPAVKNQFKKKPDFCYICSTSIDDSQGANKNYELEHIWPQSYGGDSIEENLLPACTHCNRAKSHMLLWQNAAIHSFALKPMADNGELISIQKPERIARHRQKIFQYACDNKTTLKDAALAVGSVSLTDLRYIDRDDSIDFSNFDFNWSRP